MVNRAVLRDDQWIGIEPLLSGRASDCRVTGVKEIDCFLKPYCGSAVQAHRGVIFRHTLETGIQYFTRYNRWSKKGRWKIIFEALSKDADFEYLMIDGSITRVHQHGALKKTLRKLKQLENHEVA